MVDENMENYLAVYNWLTGLGFPESGKHLRNNTDKMDKEI